MSSYSKELTPWERKNEYYSNIQIGKDVKAQTKAISIQTEALVAAQIDSANEIISSQERIEEGIDRVAYGIGMVAEGMFGLKAAFEWGISEVVWQIEQNRAVLKDILGVLIAPLDTQAKELRRRAEDAYANGWLKEALEDFLESEKKNKYDFLVHISIGMIYLFQEIDKENALEYFNKAIKYAKPKSPYHASFALLHKALIKRDFGLIEESERCTDEAVKLCTDFAEALYQNAQYNALLNKPNKAIPLLKKAIEMDVNYCEKIQNEKDFGKIRDDINNLFAELRDEQGEKARGQFTILRKKQDAFNDLINEIRNYWSVETWSIRINEEEVKEVKNCLRRIEELIRRNSYRDYLEACTLLNKLSIAQKKLCDDIETQVKELLVKYNSHIEYIKHGTKDQSNISLKRIKYVWLGIPISVFILFKVSGFAVFSGIILTVLVYFSLYYKITTACKARIKSSRKLLQGFLSKLRRIPISGNVPLPVGPPVPTPRPINKFIAAGVGIAVLIFIIVPIIVSNVGRKNAKYSQSTPNQKESNVPYPSVMSTLQCRK